MSPVRVGFPLLQPQFSGDAWPAGLQYVRNVLAALQTLPPDRVPDVVVFRSRDAVQQLVNSPVPSWYSEFRLPVDGSLRDTLRRAVRQSACDLLFPVMTAPELVPDTPLIGWIADFQHRRLPEFFSQDEYDTREIAYGLLAACSIRIVCSSRSVAGDFSSTYPQLAAKAAILRFRAAIEPGWLEQPPHETLERFGIDEPYVYMPNQFWRHKNHELAFAAWRELRQRGHRILLVCSGPTTDYRWPDYFASLERFVAEHELGGVIRILGQIDRRDQIQLYRGARLVLQPSRFEGWSTTIEEARALGKAMAVSDLPVHHEQCGDAASYFDLDQPGQLADVVLSLLERVPKGHDESAEARALADGVQRLRAYGEEIVALWEDAAQEAGSQRAATAERSLMLTALGDITERWTAGHHALQQRTLLAERLVTDLRTTLEASESDRAARLDVIERQGAALGRIGTLEADIAFLKDQIAAIEADRAARLEIIERQGRELEATRRQLQARDGSTKPTTTFD